MLTLYRRQGTDYEEKMIMASIRCWHCKQTHTSVEEVARCRDMEWEAEAEAAAERAATRYWEEGTEAQAAQYRWEVEQDERNAAFWSGGYNTDYAGAFPSE